MQVPAESLWHEMQRRASPPLQPAVPSGPNVALGIEALYTSPDDPQAIALFGGGTPGAWAVQSQGSHGLPGRMLGPLAGISAGNVVERNGGWGLEGGLLFEEVNEEVGGLQPVLPSLAGSQQGMQRRVQRPGQGRGVMEKAQQQQKQQQQQHTHYLEQQAPVGALRLTQLEQQQAQRHLQGEQQQVVLEQHQAATMQTVQPQSHQHPQGHGHLQQLDGDQRSQKVVEKASKGLAWKKAAQISLADAMCFLHPPLQGILLSPVVTCLLRVTLFSQRINSRLSCVCCAGCA